MGDPWGLFQLDVSSDSVLDSTNRIPFPVRFCGRNFECYCESVLICGGPKPSQIKHIFASQSEPWSVVPCQKPSILNNCRLPTS